MQHLSHTLAVLALGAVSTIALIASIYALYKLAGRVVLALEERKKQSIFAGALELAAKHPPPDGYGLGCCVAVPVRQDNPTGHVKYVLVHNYSVLELPDQRVWMLHCDDGMSYMHSMVIPVPGGIPDPPKERGDNTIGMGST